MRIYNETLKRKLNFLTFFLAKQCVRTSRNNAFPRNLPELTKKSLDSINCSSSDIAKAISHLHPNELHRHVILSVRMIILILKTHFANLLITFNDCSYQGRFHSEWRKAEVVPVDKKEDIQCLKNYRPISLLPTCSKSFEYLIYNTVFTNLLMMI